MSYISGKFAALTVFLLCVYYLVPKKLREYVLLLGSMIFYASSNVKFFLFLFFTAGSTYLCALTLPKLQEQQSKTLLLALCVLANTGVWFLIKALPWTVGFVQRLLGMTNVWQGWWFSAPLGISYFTLQAISYITDVYRKKISPEKNPARYLLFLSWFPAVVQGPISRYDELMPELENDRPLSVDGMGKGLFLILTGLIKKLVIADRVGAFVNSCFDGYAGLSGWVLYLGAVAYSVQIYADFSGCVDLCRGVSLLFGIRLVPNFNRPYLAESIGDFWSRWHMSLSNWLKDYVYIPLGGNRKGQTRKYLNLLITFLVSALWHGAGLSFFAWGALHAVYQIIGQSGADAGRKLKSTLGIEEDSLSDKIYKIVGTFHLVTLAWIFFRADSLTHALGYLGAMFTNGNHAMLFNGGVFTLGVSRLYFEVILLNLIVLFLVELLSDSQDAVVEGVFRQHVGVRWFVYFVMFFDLFLFGAFGSGYDMSSFLYGGF